MNKIRAENMEQKTLVDPQETEMVDPLLKEGRGGRAAAAAGTMQKGTPISALKTSWS